MATTSPIYSPTAHQFCQDKTLCPELAVSAWQQFVEQGLPTKKLPHWHYSNLSRLLKQQQYVPTDSTLLSHTPDNRLPFPVYCIVLENGQFNAAISDLPAGVTVSALRDSGQQYADRLSDIDVMRHPMTQANLALMTDGVCVRIQSSQSIDRPICICYRISSGEPYQAYHYRNIIVAESGCQVEIIEQVDMSAKCETLLNTVSQVYADANSRLTLYGVQQNHPKLTHINAWHSWLKHNSHIKGHHLAQGADINRFDGQVYLTEPGAQYQHYGAFLLQDKQHVDFAFQIDHLASHTSSNIDFRGIASDQATGIFNARAFADQHIKRLSIHQNSRNIVLSAQAKIYTQPALEIYTDDLVCTHGATVGQFDQDALAYLQLSGIPEIQARLMLQQAFLAENLQAIDHPAIFEWCQRWIS